MKYEFSGEGVALSASLSRADRRRSFHSRGRLFMPKRARARAFATPLACRRTRDAYREATCGRTGPAIVCAAPYVRIRMEIRKEAGHEQWLAALRNNVVFVGSFYLPRQECSLQSASKFMLGPGCATRSRPIVVPPAGN